MGVTGRIMHGIWGGNHGGGERSRKEKIIGWKEKAFGLRHFKLEPFTVHFSGDEVKWKSMPKNQESYLLINPCVASAEVVN